MRHTAAQRGYTPRPHTTVDGVLRSGGIAVIPTDTIYGIVARALDKKAVKRLYALRRKTPKKPFIILISSVGDLAAFGVRPNAASRAFLARVWPGKVSVVLPCSGKKFAYLHLGTGALAFRLPRSKKLFALLAKTGPLVAPSANPEGEEPARTLREARNYFRDAVDRYVAGAPRDRRPSTLVSFTGGTPVVLRQGATKISSTSDVDEKTLLGKRRRRVTPKSVRRGA